MGTRAGDIDTCVAQFIMDKYNMTADECLTMLNKKSGVLALSNGVSSDFRDLEAGANKGDEACQLALDKFCYEVRKYIGAYAAALGGLDCLVFTVGVGENGCTNRAAICEGLEFLGVKARPGAQQGARRGSPHLRGRFPRESLGHPHERRAHDRAGHCSALRQVRKNFCPGQTPGQFSTIGKENGYDGNGTPSALCFLRHAVG